MPSVSRSRKSGTHEVEHLGEAANPRDYLDEVAAELALALLTVGLDGMVTGPGPAFARKSASGTMIMPTMTVRTNVTAPHSRRRTAQFTSAEFYLDLVVVVV